ncbi:hypothetical protein OG612_13775 [Streptomyces sp. NBC_01527]|uniref:hypothetical protein n=1 Tax=Streptomyces sp. NBC_01527 TaxID=2903894 RepID=UPI003865A389
MECCHSGLQSYRWHGKIPPENDDALSLAPVAVQKAPEFRTIKTGGTLQDLSSLPVQPRRPHSAEAVQAGSREGAILLVGEHNRRITNCGLDLRDRIAMHPIASLPGTQVISQTTELQLSLRV